MDNLRIKKDLIYEFIKDIKDPEKDCTIEDLEIINEDSIEIINSSSKTKSNYDTITITWKPTSPNCSLALNIGLSIRRKLEDEIKEYFREITKKNNNWKYKYKLDIIVVKGSHLLEDDINKQLNDKERYFAAMENPDIAKYINRLIE